MKLILSDPFISRGDYPHFPIGKYRIPAADGVPVFASVGVMRMEAFIPPQLYNIIWTRVFTVKLDAETARITEFPVPFYNYQVELRL